MRPGQDEEKQQNQLDRRPRKQHPAPTWESDPAERVSNLAATVPVPRIDPGRYKSVNR